MSLSIGYPFLMNLISVEKALRFITSLFRPEWPSVGRVILAKLTPKCVSTDNSKAGV